MKASICPGARPRSEASLVTPQTFAQWHNSKAAAKQQAAEDAAQVRRRNGALTGREIFQQACLYWIHLLQRALLDGP